MIRSTILLASVLVFVAAPAGWLHAADPTPNEKQRFIDTICGGIVQEERCLNAARLVAGRSLNWIMFEACSASGERDLVVKCFDRASTLAGDLTGDPRYLDNQRRCNRFDGEHVDEAKLLCYRSAFKYRNYYAEHYGHLWDYANTQ
jgi:hypothetical protein